MEQATQQGQPHPNEHRMLILLCGEYKTGKTVSACTFPKPMVFFDFDDGFKSVINVKDKQGNLVVPDYDKIDVVKFFRPTAAALDFTTDMGKGAGIAPKHTKDSLELLNTYNATVNGLFTSDNPPKTLVIDSLTSMFRLWKYALLAKNNIPSLRIPDYGTLEGVLFGQFIPTLKALSQRIPYIILIDHLLMDKDEISGRVMEFPIGPSRQQGKDLGKEFDEIWLQKEEGSDRVWRTRRHIFFQAGSRLNLPDPIKPATYATLQRYLNKA